MTELGFRPPRIPGRVHWLGLWTLLRREVWRMLKFWVENVGAAVFNAVLYLAVLVLALGPARGTAAADALLTFAVPGLVAFTVLQRAAEATAFSLVFDKMERMIADVLMPPLSPSELTAGYALSGAAAGLLPGVPVLLAGVLVFGMPADDPLLMAVFAGLGAVMLSLTGVLIGLWADKWDHLSAAFTFVLLPLSFLSGLFVPVEALPGPLAVVVRCTPVFYAIDGFRAAASGAASAPVGLSLAVVAGTAAALWLACDRVIRSGWKIKA